MAKKELDTIKKIITELLEKLTVKSETKVEEREDSFLVSIETEEPGPLIGYHGRSLEALQLIVGLIAYKRLGQWLRVIVTVGDYRQRREEQLRDLALSTAEKVLHDGNEVTLFDLSPSERRIVHMALSEHAQIDTESQGEGRQRRLIVKAKEPLNTTK